MPSVVLHTEKATVDESVHQILAGAPTGLPTLLNTPSGLAILEIQGRLHVPLPGEVNGLAETSSSARNSSTTVGRIEFPQYNAVDDDVKEGEWMKRVYLYVGKYQRLTGEVKKLAKPTAVIRKRTPPQATTNVVDVTMQINGTAHEDQSEELEIVGIVKYKIIFSGRPEPVSE